MLGLKRNYSHLSNIFFGIISYFSSHKMDSVCIHIIYIAIGTFEQYIIAKLKLGYQRKFSENGGFVRSILILK